jgi:hypothetical protein
MNSAAAHKKRQARRYERLSNLGHGEGVGNETRVSLVLLRSSSGKGNSECFLHFCPRSRHREGCTLEFAGIDIIEDLLGDCPRSTAHS